MEEFFRVRYEFDKKKVDEAIDNQVKSASSSYICVSDGVVLDKVNKDDEYRRMINGGLFSVCDSSYVPLYLKWLYGIRREQYTGHQLFLHIMEKKKYRMIFLGSSHRVLKLLKERLLSIDPRVADMQFVELPYAEAEDFDYSSIGDMINRDCPDIIWVSLGAPKQEKFMHYLVPHVKHGVLISVGAVFKFVSGVEARRAPQWMVRNHLEFIHRIFVEPRKQLRRSASIIGSLPRILLREYKRKNKS
ncbi:MAG: WecB/TagA/CpsF family glycosyltransferase [Muribaculaceae bacterium]|nr:WecB/TagA/CpsF family glycosyltransferase [Muribaculaceae bacterium]